jgi:hypothetical protein
MGTTLAGFVVVRISGLLTLRVLIIVSFFLSDSSFRCKLRRHTGVSHATAQGADSPRQATDRLLAA